MNNREAFEAWYQNDYVQFGRANFHLNSYGEYSDDDLEASWCAWQAALALQAQQSQWIIPTESQILAATEKAGLWPNTVYTWLPAFHRYHAELAKLPPEPEGGA